MSDITVKPISGCLGRLQKSGKKKYLHVQKILKVKDQNHTQNSKSGGPKEVIVHFEKVLNFYLGKTQ